MWEVFDFHGGDRGRGIIRFGGEFLATNLHEWERSDGI